MTGILDRLLTPVINYLRYEMTGILDRLLKLVLTIYDTK